uniref:Putative ovule protein n=1 Tax=Solanum chacoense TaxID=4108 RepID=A0A0V0GQ25_SOLCH
MLLPSTEMDSNSLFLFVVLLIIENAFLRMSIKHVLNWILFYIFAYMLLFALFWTTNNVFLGKARAS